MAAADVPSGFVVVKFFLSLILWSRIPGGRCRLPGMDVLFGLSGRRDRGSKPPAAVSKLGQFR